MTLTNLFIFAGHVVVIVIGLLISFRAMRSGREAGRYTAGPQPQALPTDAPQPQRPVIGIALGLLLVPLLARAIFSGYPRVEAALMPYWLYAPVERDYWLPSAVLFFALASHLMVARQRRAIFLLTCVASVFVISQTAWRLSEPAEYDSTESARNNVCMQTSDYTCGPAALVALLSTMDIEATEGEMARLSRAIPGRGVSHFQAADALDRKLDQLSRSEQVRLISSNSDNLDVLPTPFVASIQFSFWFDHMVCVLAVTPTTVDVADPLEGRRRWTCDEFESRWRGFAVVAQ